MAFENQTALLTVDSDLHLEQYGGAVESQFAKSSFMRDFVKIVPILGGDTVSNNRIGRTTLKKLVAGVRPDAAPVTSGKVTVTVDTVILAREQRGLLDTFQESFDVRTELGTDHGKEMGKFFDQAHIIGAMKGAKAAAPKDSGGSVDLPGFGAGKIGILGATSDELDPDKLYAKIEAVVTAMEEEEIDVDELVLLVRPKTYMVLANNNKLLDREFSTANGDFAGAIIREAAGVRIIKTARIPIAAITGHDLSNAGNSNFFDVTAEDAKVVAVFVHPKSLLSGETIEMTSDVWFNKEEKMWFIDSWMAFGLSVNRPDVCGAIWKFGTTGITENV